jgi:hypothetical protein
MQNNDLHSNIKTMTVLAPRALATVAGSKTSKFIDRTGYGGVEFIFSYGATSASTAAIPVVIKEGDVTGTMTSVADADLIGTEALAGIGLVARTSGTGKNVTKRIGYKGTKKYVAAYIGTVSAAVVTVANIFGIAAVLHCPSIAPTTNP